MCAELYEDGYKRKNRFSFGKNWQEYIRLLNGGKIREAEKSILSFLGKEHPLKGKSFVDIGCGSGLFSLAASSLGARKVVSVDIDDYSVKSAVEIRKRFSKGKQWSIKKGSILDKKFVDSLGQFDIVYSWGVLHHSGDMEKAFFNASRLAKKGSLLYIAIYNKNEKYWWEGTSSLWHGLKRIYNSSGYVVKYLMYTLYKWALYMGLVASLRSPAKYVEKYKSFRGMDFYTDIKDWLGGYPYEYASVGDVAGHFEKLGFRTLKVKPARSLGCNEFLFRKVK
jgi:2-polyprenyl-3-methyl-5-hydroxy-6-metoxy-1,4-benzoquinol methylase